jgi:RHS repeat-associated protein
MRFHYDPENRKISAERETACGWVSDRFAYDRHNRISSHTDPDGNVTEFLYAHKHVNLLGQKVLSKKTTDPTGLQTIEIFDAQDRLICTEKKDSLGQSAAKEERIYDRMGNCVKQVTTIYHHNTPRSSTHVYWQYDSMGRMIKQIESDKKVTSFTYDERGREVQRIMPSGVILRSSYDGIDRLETLVSSDHTINYQYRYSTHSEPIAIYDHVHNWELNRTYNIFGELTYEESPCRQHYRWDYDTSGRCTQFTLTDGSCVAYTYQAHHLSQVCRLSAQGELLYTHRYLNYDVNGHVSQEQLILQGGSQITQRDRMERPIQKRSDWCTETRKYNPSSLVAQTEHSLCGNKTYAYDPLNQLTQEGKIRYAFDSLGNPLSCAVNDLNQIVASSDETFTYDLNGNLIQKLSASGITTYTYDALNRLTSITHSDGQYTTYLYDALSRLISEQTNGIQHFYLYDQLQEVGSSDAAGNIVQFKVLGLGIKGEIGAAVAIELNNAPYIPLNDLNGNIVGLIDADHALVESYAIDAFGKETTPNTPMNPWRFCSKRKTDSLYLFGKRFYDPQLGRWLTPDPAGFADGMNLYVYVLNSPLNRLDLFGLDSDFSFQNSVRIEMSMRHLSMAQSQRIPTILPCQVLVDGALSQWMVSCGHWHKLQFTPEEVKTGKVNIVDHFQELLPHEGSNIGLITDLNGIQVKLRDIKDNMRFLTQAIPEGTLTFAMHSPTKGFISDLVRTFQERKGKETQEVIRGRQFLGAMLEVMDKINPEMFFLHIAHSRGAATSHAIINGMTEEQKAQLQNKMFYLGLGPAKAIKSGIGKQVANTYSSQDAITGWFGIPHLRDSRYDIRFVKCESRIKERTAFFADHARLGKTYRVAQKDYFDELRLHTRFYNDQVP